MEFILEPWPWYVSGPLIALVMFLLLGLGKNFGMSANLRTLCTIGGAGKFADFFKFDWKSQRWNLIVVAGAIVGGFVASEFLSTSSKIDLNPDTVVALKEMGFNNAGDAYVPSELYSFENMDISVVGILLLAGVLVGFGSRYAGGCTSGHAISGLSDLQLPSLIAVIGFFIGGLFMTHVLLPIIF